jgi:hypothetical protein
MDKKINSTDNITQSVEDINTRLDRIEKMLITIEELLNPIIESSNNMNNHIDFIETIYDRIKSPFHFIMDRITNNPLVTYIDPSIITYIEDI